MAHAIRIVYAGGQGEIVEKKSRFIATIAPAATEEEAQLHIERIKKQYWDARHNCSAMVIGEKGELTRCSDDGEPPHTAGRPMLEILLGEEVRNVCVVVTRYFGGVLLGTGGLVRAYQAAVREGLSHCTIIEKQQAIPVRITTDYTGIGKLLYLAGSAGYPITDTVYESDVKSRILLPPEALDAFTTSLKDATAGNAVLLPDDPVWYAMIDGAVTYF